MQTFKRTHGLKKNYKRTHGLIPAQRFQSFSSYVILLCHASKNVFISPLKM